jgi:hypothetical protein
MVRGRLLARRSKLAVWQPYFHDRASPLRPCRDVESLVLAVEPREAFARVHEPTT